jgi:hypothetical protein
MTAVGFEPAIAASERLQTLALELSVPGKGTGRHVYFKPTTIK